ncbi:MAG TPA: hypothetical protein VN739_00100 [Nitrososphaerales archaeon]|nr:hypothetical protein [Nitrososphaerales archaeon]
MSTIPSSPDLSLMLLQMGVCSYNNLESNGAQMRHVVSNDKCLCTDSFPLSDSYDEPEYRASLESRTAVEIFSFICESGLNPRPLWDTYKIKMPSQLWAIVSPAIRIVEPLKGLKLEDLETVKHKNQIIESYSFLNEKVGSACATDILHLLAPELFVPWDDMIMEQYGFTKYEQDYYKFLEISRKELIDVLTETQMTQKALRGSVYQRGWKPLTKLLDEYHFARVRKLPPHFN